MFWKFFKAECGLVWQVSIPGNPDVRSSELTHKQAYRRYAEGTWRKKKKKKKSRALPRWRTAQSSAHSLQHSLIQDKSLRLMLMGEGRKPLPTRALASQGLLFWGRGRSKYGLPKGGGRNSLGAGSIPPPLTKCLNLNFSDLWLLIVQCGEGQYLLCWPHQVALSVNRLMESESQSWIEFKKHLLQHG